MAGARSETCAHQDRAPCRRETLKHETHEKARKPRNTRHPFRALRSPSCHSCFKRPSTTPTSSSVKPYNSYTSPPICRSVASICR